MSRNAGVRIGRRAGVIVALVGLAGCASVEALNPLGSGPELRAERQTERQAVKTRKKLERGKGKYVVIDLDSNELRFMDGDESLWSAPVGTGTGLQLRGDAEDWDFSTPNGSFNVQFKELDPVWIKPDWYFVKNKLPIPPDDSPERRVPGGLGEAAVYLGHQIAIHGTDKPELLGQRVSHGCIRLADENAMRLFHNVQVGTPVIIVGGRSVVKRDFEDADAVVPTNPAKPKPKVKDPLLTKPTRELLALLDRQVEEADESSKWAHTTSVLIARGLDDDSTALRGLLRRAGKTDNRAFEREFGTFIADAFARGSLRAVVSLARIEPDARNRAARALVQATMDLYPGDIDAPGAPWPTRRVPLFRLGPDGSLGWRALESAEQAYREGDADGVRVVLESDS